MFFNTKKIRIVAVLALFLTATVLSSAIIAPQPARAQFSIPITDANTTQQVVGEQVKEVKDKAKELGAKIK